MDRNRNSRPPLPSPPEQLCECEGKSDNYNDGVNNDGFDDHEDGDKDDDVQITDLKPVPLTSVADRLRRLRNKSH